MRAVAGAEPSAKVADGVARQPYRTSQHQSCPRQEHPPTDSWSRSAAIRLRQSRSLRLLTWRSTGSPGEIRRCLPCLVRSVYPYWTSFTLRNIVRHNGRDLFACWCCDQTVRRSRRRPRTHHSFWNVRRRSTRLFRKIWPKGGKRALLPLTFGPSDPCAIQKKVSLLLPPYQAPISLRPQHSFHSIWRRRLSAQINTIEQAFGQRQGMTGISGKCPAARNRLSR